MFSGRKMKECRAAGFNPFSVRARRKSMIPNQKLTFPNRSFNPFSVRARRKRSPWRVGGIPPRARFNPFSVRARRKRNTYKMCLTILNSCFNPFSVRARRKSHFIVVEVAPKTYRVSIPSPLGRVGRVRSERRASVLSISFQSLLR